MRRVGCLLGLRGVLYSFAGFLSGDRCSFAEVLPCPSYMFTEMFAAAHHAPVLEVAAETLACRNRLLPAFLHMGFRGRVAVLCLLRDRGCRLTNNEQRNHKYHPEQS